MTAAKPVNPQRVVWEMSPQLPADAIVGRPAGDFLEQPESITRLALGGARSETAARLVADDGRRVPVALWMVGFDDAALLIVQAQDLRGIVADEHLLV